MAACHGPIASETGGAGWPNFSSIGAPVVVATLDYLLKGAATQAMQNLNLAFGFTELTSIPVKETTT